MISTMITADEAKAIANQKLLNDIAENIKEQAKSGKFFSECINRLINDDVISVLKKYRYKVSQEYGRYVEGEKTFIISWSDDNQIIEKQLKESVKQYIVYRSEITSTGDFEF
jgi:hypothetical protein